MPAPPGFEEPEELEFLGVEVPEPLPPRRPNREKTWCEAGRHVSWNGAFHRTCPDCTRELTELALLYKKILAEKPHLGELTMSQVFQKMWDSIRK